MNTLITPVLVILIGLFVRSRLLAVLFYLALEAILFSFQTLTVLLAWMGGQGGFGGAADQGAFGPPPTGFPVAFDEAEVWAYGLVNAGIIATGAALTVVVVVLCSRRRAKKQTAADTRNTSSVDKATRAKLQ